MGSSSWRAAAAAADQYSYDNLEDEIAVGRWDLAPGERIGPPLPRRGLRRAIRFSVVLALGAVGIWAWTDESARPVVETWARGAGEAAKSLLAHMSQPAVAPSSVQPTQAAPGAAPLSGTQPAPAEPAPPEGTQAMAEPDAHAAAAVTADVPRPDAAAPPVPANAAPADAAAKPDQAAEVNQTAPVEVVTLREPRVAGPGGARAAAAYDAASPGSQPAGPLAPHQKRAAAAGLHPGLSKELLGKLTKVDLSNASAAIETALSETGDDEVLYWPKKAKPGQAQYQVHFVAGAASGCRRYVVTIAKAGWRTTALPMEKCGVLRKTAWAKS